MSSKEGEPSSINKELPSETLLCLLFRAVSWAVAEAAFMCSLRRVDFPGRTGMAWPARVVWLLRANRPFATNDHMVQNLPCWRGSSLLFPHWDIKTKASHT